MGPDKPGGKRTGSKGRGAGSKMRDYPHHKCYTEVKEDDNELAIALDSMERACEPHKHTRQDGVLGKTSGFLQH